MKNLQENQFGTWFFLAGFVVKNEKKGRTTMIQNETKSPEILKAERQVEQAIARLLWS